MYGIHLEFSEDSDKPRTQQLPYPDSAATAEPLMSQNHQGLQILQPGIARHSWLNPRSQLGFPRLIICLGFRSPWRPAHPACPLCPTCVGGPRWIYATPYTQNASVAGGLRTTSGPSRSTNRFKAKLDRCCLHNSALHIFGQPEC